MKTLRGDWLSIARNIDELKSGGSNAWLEVIYEGDEIASDLRTRLGEAIEGSELVILPIKNNRVLERAMSGMDTYETLDDLDAADMFHRCLESHEIPEDQRPALMSAYQEIIIFLNEADAMADTELHSNANCVGFIVSSSTYCNVRLRRLLLAALLSF